jgi:hypothetical protein
VIQQMQKNGSVDDLRLCETSQSGEIISQFSAGPSSPHAPRQSIKYREVRYECS